jgi:hypothetical protein
MPRRRTEFKRADLTGTKMEIWTAVYEAPPGDIDPPPFT